MTSAFQQESFSFGVLKNNGGSAEKSILHSFVFDILLSLRKLQKKHSRPTTKITILSIQYIIRKKRRSMKTYKFCCQIKLFFSGGDFIEP